MENCERPLCTWAETGRPSSKIGECLVNGTHGGRRRWLGRYGLPAMRAVGGEGLGHDSEGVPPFLGSGRNRSSPEMASTAARLGIGEPVALAHTSHRVGQLAGRRAA
jgi:hypothetical protein